MKVLITGGAGFIGSHLTDSLIKKGHEVTAFDNFSPQVHKAYPTYLNPSVKVIKGDVKNKEELHKALENIEAVYHFAAIVGVGQSMYEIDHYTNTNVGGTANLWDVLVNKKNQVKKVIVASSMSLYGEGTYICKECSSKEFRDRTQEQMKNKDWEMKCKNCDSNMDPIPTPETKVPVPDSVYAYTKKFQEDMSLNIGKTYGIPSVALRFFNAVGPRQALSNPYTGVAAIFMSRIKNNNSPLVFEDGKQLRDFVSIQDISQACTLSLEKNSANYEVFNVGSGNKISVSGLATVLNEIYGTNHQPQITHKFRVGDVRHCFADISKIKSKLDFESMVPLKEELKLLSEWSKNEESTDKVDHMKDQLESKGLVK